MAGCRCGCGHGGDQGLAIGSRPRHYGGDERVAQVAREATALAVLERFGVNHCCGGHLSLREGAAAAGVALPDLLDALEAAGGRPA